MMIQQETTQREMSRRIVAQFLTCLDELSMEDKETSGTVVVIGATSRPDSIDPSLRYENSTVTRHVRHSRDTRLTGGIVVGGHIDAQDDLPGSSLWASPTSRRAPAYWKS